MSREPTETYGAIRGNFFSRRTVWAVFVWSRSTIFQTRYEALKILVCLCPKMWFGGISQASLHRQLAHPALTARTFISPFEHAYCHMLIPLWDQCFLLLLEPYCLTWPCASAKEVFLTPQTQALSHPHRPCLWCIPALLPACIILHALLLAYLCMCMGARITLLRFTPPTLLLCPHRPPFFLPAFFAREPPALSLLSCFLPMCINCCVVLRFLQVLEVRRCALTYG